MPVYFVRSGFVGDVKIGTAIDVAKRIRGMQTGHPQKLRILRVVEGGRAEEAALHQRFAEFRTGGEWFRFSPLMVGGELPFPDLPIPLKSGAEFADTPHGRRQRMSAEILELLGGATALAKRLGIPPWHVNGWSGMPSDQRSAIALLCRDVGRYDITVAVLKKLDDEYSDELAQKRDRDAAALRLKHDRWSQTEWLKKNPAANAWWDMALFEAPSEKKDAAA